MAMVITDDEMLARLGVTPAKPFDWGDEPQMTIDDVNKPQHQHDSLSDQCAPPPPLSGLDSIKKFIKDNSNKGRGDGGSEKKILQSLLENAKVDLSTPVPPSSMVPPVADGNKRGALTENELRDVSIRGLSDRAMAELNVESRTSVFGSILRLFDMPREGEKTDTIVKNVIGVSGSVNRNSSIDSAGAVTNDKSSVAGIREGSSALSVPAAVAASVTAAPPAKVTNLDPTILKEPILSTAEIVRSVHLSARPGDIPAGMDSKEYTMAVLHFMASHVPYLCDEDETKYGNQSSSSKEGWDQLRKTLPVLPLLKATNPGASLELRCYGRIRPLLPVDKGMPGAAQLRRKYPETMDRDEAFRIKVLNLERIFSSSLPFSSPSTRGRLSFMLTPASSSNTTTQSSLKGTATTTTEATTSMHRKSGNDLPFAFQRYVPRRKLVPHVEGGIKEELTLMISGHMQQPQHTPGPKPKSAKPKVTPSAPAASSGGAGGGQDKALTPVPVKSSSHAFASGGTSATKVTNKLKPTAAGKEKAGVDSYLTPSKRKADANIDSMLHLAKRGKEFDI